MTERGAFRGAGASAPGGLGVDLGDPAADGLGALRDALGALRDALGALRNGLGALENLELLLKSIKVGQKALFAAVSAVHADCAPMVQSALAVRDVLAASGVAPGCARKLCEGLAASLRQLESALARTVTSGRLSVAARLDLEVEIARAARELGATLPLASLLDRASRTRPLELTPVELIHAASSDAAEPDAIDVHVHGEFDGLALPIDLDAAKLLISIGVSLVVHGHPEREASMTFSAVAGGRTATTIVRGRGEGAVVSIVALRVIEPTLACARAAALRLGGSLDYDPTERRSIIVWPLSE